MEQALKYIQSYLDNDANKGYGSQYDLDVEIAREEGEKAGIKSNQMSTVKNLIGLGSTNDFISKATGLEESAIERIRSNQK